LNWEKDDGLKEEERGRETRLSTIPVASVSRFNHVSNTKACVGWSRRERHSAGNSRQHR